VKVFLTEDLNVRMEVTIHINSYKNLKQELKTAKVNNEKLVPLNVRMGVTMGTWCPSMSELSSQGSSMSAPL